MFGQRGLGLFLIAVPYSFLYGVVSRLPMIYAMVHMLYYLELTGMVPACLFAAYCLGRLLGAVSTSSFFSMATMVLGTLSGLISHAGILLDMDSPAIFGSMVFLSGFTETVTGIDVIMKMEALVEDFDQADEQRVFRCHFVSVTAGAVGAYVGGGTVYDLVGIQGICWIGVGCSLIQLVVLAIYGWPRRRFYRKLFPTADDLIQILEERERELMQEENSEAVEVNEAGEVGAQPSTNPGARCSRGSRRSSLLEGYKHLSIERASLLSETIYENNRRTSLVTAVTGRRDSLGREVDFFTAAGDPLGVQRLVAAAKMNQEAADDEARWRSTDACPSCGSCCGGGSCASSDEAGRIRKDVTETVSLNLPVRVEPVDSVGEGAVEQELARQEQAQLRAQKEMAAIASQKVVRGVKTDKVASFYAVMSPQDKFRTTVAGWSLVLSYFVTAFPIGQNFALMPLFWRVQWGKNTTVSGLLMSSGEVLGLVVLVPLAMKCVFQLPVVKPFRKPVNLVVSALISSGMVLLVIFPNMWVSGFGCVCVHIVNVLLHTFCNEITAAWIPADVYAKWVGRCYIAKRLSNTTMAFVCTSIFTYVSVTASFKIIGTIVGAWSFVLAYVFYRCELLPWQRKEKDDPSSRTQEEEIAHLKLQVANLLQFVENANAAVMNLELSVEGRLGALHRDVRDLARKVDPTVAAASFPHSHSTARLRVISPSEWQSEPLGSEEANLHFTI